ncbi:mRNA-binding translational repressor SSD1 PWA37_004816 [Arxiozyma heterogenica]|uniref:mRNA-binding translational repressor SSD1 n=1 Tax=Arxiozyma heterogenica TaxID=278026 RepID=UPI002F1E89C7
MSSSNYQEMNNNNYNSNNINDNDNDSNNLYVPPRGSNNSDNQQRRVPKHIHVAHRRTQSELTNLMIEQLTLQRQLEQVQQQQQQLLAQQQQYEQAAGYSMPTPPFVNNYNNFNNNNNNNNHNHNQGNRSRTHSRNNSGYYQDYNNTNFNVNSNNNNNNGTPTNPHRRTGSSSNVYGHSRRHSLQINEAKKAAATEQAKRTGIDINVEDTSFTFSNLSNEYPNNNIASLASQEQSSFKFPPSSTDTGSHRRTNSNSVPFFKFPPNNTNYDTSGNDDDFIPSSSTYRRQRTRNNNNNEPFSPSGINSNWRAQSISQNQQPNSNQFLSPQFQPSPSQPIQQQQSYSYNQSPYHGHRKANSRDFNSFSSLEPPAVFQQGHRSRPSNSSIQSFQSNTTNGGSQRKSLFAPYLPQANIPQLIQEGRLVAGILRVNKKNRSDAWVSTDGTLDADIYICGSKDRNRALEGDLVAVELLVVDEVWESKKEKEEKKRRKDASLQEDFVNLNSNDDYHNDASGSVNATTNISGSAISSNAATTSASLVSSTYGDDHIISTSTLGGSLSRNDTDNDMMSSNKIGLKRKGSLKQRPTQKKNDDVEVEGQSLLLVEEEEINDQFKPLYAGHVVAVLDRIPGQLFSGTLGLLRPSQVANNKNKDVANNGDSVAKAQQAPKIAWFKPIDKKVPLIAIPTELAPKDFVENADKYADKLFVASIKRWPITSLHPFGILVSELGAINDTKTEIDSILRDNNFLSNEYLDPKDPSQEKSTYQPFPIDEENWNKRTKFDESFNIIGFTERGTISEFALHLKSNNDGTLELGCHVVDATEQIDANSSLDKRARKRSTGVFMPQRVVNLLPQALNDGLTFKANKENAAISIVYTLDVKTLKIKSTWIGESVITPGSIVDITTVENIYNGVKNPFYCKLEEIATCFYRGRINSTDAKLAPVLSLFESLDDEKVKVDLNIFDRSYWSIILNEIQRKVNCTVAERIYSKLGDKAFLRRQAQPIVTKMCTFKKKIQKFGYDVDTTSPDTIIRSILQIPDDDVRKGVEILLFKTLSRAKYFVAGKVDPDQYGHFALNLPIYTHFTQPLRRYADHVVHRQLKSIINNTSYDDDVGSLKITAEYCNFKKDCAYQAQEQAVHLLLCKTINDMGNATGQLFTMATVLQVYESSFDVFIPEFGIEKRVHGDQLPLIKAEFDGEKKILELHWQRGIDSATYIPEDERNPKSYRNSIKNKFKSTTAEIANMEFSSIDNGDSMISDSLAEELSKLQITTPVLRLPERSSSEEDALEAFINTTVIRKENDCYIQEIHELQQVPILLRAEIGMALPCLSVRALNPFIKRG